MNTKTNSADIKFRVDLAFQCRDADFIPKVAGAGEIVTLASGERVQVMHDGTRLLADTYYGSFITEIITSLKGHHEPQEERVFHEVLAELPPGSVMIELGAYWGYYSLWFQNRVPGARNIMVEPETESILVGKRNFALNGRCGTFIQAAVGRRDSAETTPCMVSVDGLMAAHGLQEVAVLHCDIQGYEHEMLLGAAKAFSSKSVTFCFISTHGGRAHAKCLHYLAGAGYHLLAEHTPFESYSHDGLIVACAHRPVRRIPISRRRGGWTDRAKSALCRLGALLPLK